MIFECKELHARECECESGCATPTSYYSTLRWFHNTPVILRKILMDCTRTAGYKDCQVSLEALRDAVAEAAMLCTCSQATDSGPVALATATATECPCCHVPEIPPPFSLLTISDVVSSEMIITSSFAAIALGTSTTGDPVPTQASTTCSHEVTHTAVTMYEEEVH